jgi:hypothetical protein
MSGHRDFPPLAGLSPGLGLNIAQIFALESRRAWRLFRAALSIATIGGRNAGETNLLRRQLILVMKYLRTAPIKQFYRLGVAWARGLNLPRAIGTSLKKMAVSLRQLAILCGAALLASAVAGCGTINEKMAAGIGDYVPRWAGGLPADAPPRPGTAKYDAFMAERERQRLMPAAEREKEQKAQQPDQSGLDPVH